MSSVFVMLLILISNPICRFNVSFHPIQTKRRQEEFHEKYSQLNFVANLSLETSRCYKLRERKFSRRGDVHVGQGCLVSFPGWDQCSLGPVLKS